MKIIVIVCRILHSFVNDISIWLIAEAALNLFINSNAQELLKEMKPALRSKLTNVMESFIDRLFSRIPLEQFLE